MTTDHSIFDLILNASILVQLVILTLALASIVSWSMIINKRVVLKRAKKDADVFETKFWSVDDLSPLYKQITGKRYIPSGMEKIFESGFKEFVRLSKQQNIDPKAVLDGCQRSMRIALNKEMDHIETSLSFLATVGSTSPYVGLFGTVWGIMNSFQALGAVQQATISMVAPGISEALIATAMGLFAAIPAVVAYNRFSYETERLINRYDNFTEEFASILHRHAHS
jgi:biopolymer transport protein TolQ